MIYRYVGSNLITTIQSQAFTGLPSLINLCALWLLITGVQITLRL